MEAKLREWILLFKKHFLTALPVILFFLFNFWVVTSFFGIQYAMVVSVFTTVFQIQHLRNQSILYFVKVICFSLLLCVLAFLASLHLALCIGLNICVPFLLIFVQASQINPKGYFAYAMMFVFLELMPPAPSALWMELVVVFVSSLILIAALLFYSRFFRKPVEKGEGIHQGFQKLADLLDRFAENTINRKELYDLKNSFYKISYNNHKPFSLYSEKTKLQDMFFVLFQRVFYLVSDSVWQDETEKKGIQEIRYLAQFLRKVDREVSRGENGILIQQAYAMLEEMRLPEGRLRICVRSILHMLILILRTMEHPVPHRLAWKINGRELLVHIRRKCTMGSFEMRVALRLAVVLVVSFTISWFLPVTHSYWIPLNAFLLIQPDYEESAHRMKTRPIGTVIGCVIEYLVYPYLPGMAGRFAFALVMLSLMYCATPGTWNHPIFSTCYALTLASMTMEETLAIELRMIYLLAAVGIVFLVNVFVFPTKKKVLFQLNIKELFRAQKEYWEIVKDSVYGWQGISVSSGLLAHFHMIYEQVMDYLKNPTEELDQDAYRRNLLTLWHMFSELEQIEYLIEAGALSPEEYQSFLGMASSIQEQIQAASPRQIQLSQAVNYQEKDLNYVLEQYLKNAAKLQKV